MAVLALDRKVQVSINPETYYLLWKLAQQKGSTLEEVMNSLICEHPDVDPDEVNEKKVWICTCGFISKDTKEVSNHRENFPDHTVSEGIQF